MSPHNLLSTPDINGFWPFANYATISKTFVANTNNSIPNNGFSTGDMTFGSIKETQSFNGIFSSYGYSEFIFYILLGFAIIYVPKLW